MPETREVFECIGGPLDGERRPAPLSSTPFANGTYVLDDDPQFGAVWRWLVLVG